MESIIWKGFDIMTNIQTKQRVRKSLCKFILIFVLLLIFMMGTLHTTALAVDQPQVSRLGFTSDVHANTIDLETWLGSLRSSGTPSLDHFIFGGDFQYRPNEDQCHVTVAECVRLVNEEFSGAEIYTARGNHDVSNVANFGNKGTAPITNSTSSNTGYNTGLVYNGSDYAVYIMDLLSSRESFQISDIFALAAELNRIDHSKPVFIVAHFPIHHYSIRTTENALNLIDVLNNHSNVVFLWGHNHSLPDRNYGKVLKADDTIQYADYSYRKIGFTYGSMGAMFNEAEVRGNRGLLTTINKYADSSDVSLVYKNLLGSTTASYSVKISSDLPQTHRIKFESNGGTRVNPIDVAKYSNIELPEAPTREGFVFDGWFKDNITFEDKFLKEVQITSDMTLYAKWLEVIPGTYKLTFDSKGGSKVNPIVNIEKGATVDLPKIPIRDGYIFGGWFIDSGLTNEFTESTKVNKNMTLYAKWIEIEESFTVTFNTRGGSAIDPITGISKGDTIELPVTFKEGYVFVGWFTDTALKDQFTEDTPVVGDITLYPKGVRGTEAETYTVTFDSKGGSTVAPIKDIVKGTAVDLPSPPVKEGFVFEGWFKDAELKDEFTQATLVTSNMSVYAKWTEILVGRHTLTFNSNGGSEVLAITNIENATSVSLPKQPIKEGHKFDGWFIDAGLKNEFTEMTLVRSSMTLYAKWIEVGETFTVTFNSRGGSPIDPIAGIVKGNTIELPEAFKEGYDFIGWFTDIALKNQFTEETPVTENLTLYPKGVRSVEGTFTLRFDSNGGSSVSPITGIAKDSTVKLPAAPNREGYIFEGWFTDAGLTNEFTQASLVNSNITVYAKWEDLPIGNYTVMFDSKGGSPVNPITGIKDGSTINLPSPPNKEGFAFGGWFTDSGLADKFTETTAVTSNMTVYAKWMEAGETFTVTFNTRGGSLIDPIKGIVKGATIELPESFKEGYVFVGWFTDSGLRDQFTEETPVVADITLYPKGTRTVTFDSKGGSPVMAIEDVEEEELEDEEELEKILDEEDFLPSQIQVDENIDEEILYEDSDEERQVEYVDGIYQTEIEDDDGVFIISATVEDGRIIEIEIMEGLDNIDIGQEEFEEIQTIILENQLKEIEDIILEEEREYLYEFSDSSLFFDKISDALKEIIDIKE